MRIRTRNDLIKFIEDHPPSPGILRALMYRNDNLGGFRKLPVGQTGGWIVDVTTPIKQNHHRIVVQPDDRTTPGYRIWILLDPIPWEHYNGDQSKNELYQGDYPERFKELKENAKKKRPNETRPGTSITDRLDRSDTSEGNGQ